MQSSIWRKGAVALAAVIALGVSAMPASANGFGSRGIGGFGLGAVYSGLENRIPYFAAHPPVYYSYPVPRTYGYSPFAYPPGTVTPELDLAAAQPKVIANPHVDNISAPVQDTKRDSTVSTPTNRGPLVINNPYAAGGPRVLPASQAL